MARVIPQVIAITGTDGKTTCVLLVAQLLRKAGLACLAVSSEGVHTDSGTVIPIQARYCTPTGIPDLIAELGKDQDVVVLEAFSRGIALGAWQHTQLDALLITEITSDHLDFHGTHAAYIATKLSLISHVRHGGAVISGISDKGIAQRAAILSEVNGASFCLGEELRILSQELNHTRYASKGNFEITIQGPAVASCDALALALSCLNALGIEHSYKGVLTLPIGRAVVFRSAVSGDAMVDPAHTAGAIERLLYGIRPLVPGRLIVVFGAGGNKDRQKRAVMGKVAAALADIVVVTDDNSRTEDPGQIRAEILSGIEGPCYEIPSRAEAIAIALEWSEPSDLVLVLGRGAEAEQDYGGRREPFCDIEFVKHIQDQLVPQAVSGLSAG